MATTPAAPVGALPPSRPQTLLQHGQVAVLLTLDALTIGAWALTIHQARTMDMPMGVVARGGASSDAGAGDTRSMSDMAMDGAGAVAASGISGMAGETWSPSGFATFLAAWLVMMAAMMFPAAAPMLLLVRRVYAQRLAQRRAFVSTWVFAAGYLLVWAVFGVVTWLLVQLGSTLAGHLGAARATWAPLALGAVLALAGVYQASPLKRVCLDHCRTPLGFVMTHWRDGPRGALRMGTVHGVYCLGCCWALFLVLVAAGVMSLAWMALLTLVVFAEKVLPLGQHAARVAGVAFIILGAAVASGAADLPWAK